MNLRTDEIEAVINVTQIPFTDTKKEEFKANNLGIKGMYVEERQCGTALELAPLAPREDPSDLNHSDDHSSFRICNMYHGHLSPRRQGTTVTNRKISISSGPVYSKKRFYDEISVDESQITINSDTIVDPTLNSISEVPAALNYDKRSTSSAIIPREQSTPTQSSVSFTDLKAHYSSTISNEQGIHPSRNIQYNRFISVGCIGLATSSNDNEDAQLSKAVDESIIREDGTRCLTYAIKILGLRNTRKCAKAETPPVKRSRNKANKLRYKTLCFKLSHRTTHHSPDEGLHKRLPSRFLLTHRFRSHKLMSTCLKHNSKPMTPLQNFSFPRTVEAPSCLSLNSPTLTFTSLHNSSVRCHGELKLQKVQPLTGVSRCQFEVWEMEVITNNLKVLQSQNPINKATLTPFNSKEIIKGDNMSWNIGMKNCDSIKTLKQVEPSLNHEKAPLLWNVQPGFRVAVKFHVRNSVKSKSSTEMYRAQAIMKEAQNLQKVCTSWKKYIEQQNSIVSCRDEYTLNTTHDIEANNRADCTRNTLKSISSSLVEEPWAEEKFELCPVPQYYWALLGTLDSPPSGKMSESIQREAQHAGNTKQLSVIGVGMELIRGVPLTSIIRDIRTHGIISMSKARLVADIMYKTVRSQRFVAGLSMTNTQQLHDIRKQHSNENNDNCYGHSLINWDTKPGNIVVVAEETHKCFAKGLNGSSCPNLPNIAKKHKTRTSTLLQQNECRCPIRWHCQRSVVIDVGDALPGPDLVFPVTGVKRTRERRLNSLNNRNLGKNQLNPIRPECHSTELLNNVQEDSCAVNAYQGTKHSAIDNPSYSLQRGNSVQLTTRSSTMKKPCSSKNELVNKRSTTDRLRVVTSSNTVLSSSTTSSPSSRISAHYQYTSDVPFYTHLTEINPSSHVVCTTGFCAPECAILVFLLAAVPHHSSFRRLWYSNTADTHQMIQAREMRRKYVWQKWIAENSIIINDINSNDQQLFSPNELQNHTSSVLSKMATASSNSVSEYARNSQHLKIPIQSKHNVPNEPQHHEISIKNKRIGVFHRVQENSKDSYSSTAKQFRDKPVEQWAIRFSERSVVFSLGLVCNHLFGGKGLLFATRRDPVDIIDALCEWNDQWPDENRTHTNQKTLSKNNFEIQTEKMQTFRNKVKSECLSRGQRHRNTTKQSIFQNEISYETIEGENDAVGEDPRNYGNSSCSEHASDNTLNKRKSARQQIERGQNISGKKILVKRRSSASVSTLHCRCKLIPRQVERPNLSKNNQKRIIPPSIDRKRYRQGAFNHFCPPHYTSDLNRNFYSGKRRIGVDSIMPVNEIFHRGIIGQKTKNILLGCLQFVPGDRFTLKQLEFELRELVEILIKIELDE